MKFFKKIKKGFTLVELVVVIAVIAILSGVGVGTYIAVTNNAKKSSDQQVLDQVNKCLMLHENMPGAIKPVTMQDTLDILDKEMGVSDVQKLLTNTFSDYSFAWDKPQDRFVILEGEKIAYKDANYPSNRTYSGNEKDFWKMVSVVDSNALCSQYVTGTTYDGNEVTVISGFDAGKNIGIQKINYSSTVGQEVIIRTNGSDLVVDAANDTVNHYGKASQVNIKNINTSSFHEFGNVSFMNIDNGHAVVENDGTVDFLAANASATCTNKGKVDSANIDLPGAKKVETKAFNPEDELDGYYKLTSDVAALTNILHINPNKNVVIDLNGHNITVSSASTVAAKYSVFMVHNGGKLTLNDSVGTGVVSSNNKLYTGITMTVPKELKVDSETCDVPAELTVNGGTIIGQYYGIAGNGNEERQNTVITINGGKITGTASDDHSGIYHPQNGKLIISGGLIEGSTGIYIKSGELTLDSKFTGGTVRADGQKHPFVHNGNGMNSTGDAIVIENCDYPGGTPSLSLGNINLESAHGYDIGAYYYGVDDICGITSITNAFSLNDGYKWEQTVTGVYKVVNK